MTPLAPHLTAFFQVRLPLERQVSPHTSSAYAYAFQLLLGFAHDQLGVRPSALHLEQIDAPFVLAFLGYLEVERENSALSRNARLAAIKSFMRFVEYRVPSAIDQVRRVLAIPEKRSDQKLINHLTVTEMKAVLDAPDPQTRSGVRDRAMLHLGFTAGLRVSELVGLRLDDLTLHSSTSTILIRGKGRKERALPMTRETTNTIRAWLAVRGAAPMPELFLNARGFHLTRAGFEYVLIKHVRAASACCPSLAAKKISPHSLRHTCAMILLHATRDIRKVSLWLGHASIQSTEIYTRADPSSKLDTLDALTPPTLRRGRFQPPDRLIALLKEV
jgi:site-specific recombinase XerD